MSAIDWAMMTTASAPPRTRERHGLRGVAFTLLTLSLTLYDDETLNGEKWGEDVSAQGPELRQRDVRSPPHQVHRGTRVRQVERGSCSMVVE
jgi:hypothetical protein